MKAQSQNGFNVVGHFDSLLGTGQAARNLVQAITEAGIPVKALNVQLTEAPLVEEALWQDTMFEFTNTIWAVNPERLAQAQRRLPQVTRQTRRNIGYWWWELNEVPELFKQMSHRLDEIWAPSKFIYDTFVRCLDTPVYQVPLTVPQLQIGEAEQAVLTRSAFVGESSSFTVLVTADLLSSIDRKNVVGNVEAYKLAFNENSGAHLIVKVLNGKIRPQAQKQILDSIAGRKDITLMDEVLSRAEMLQLLASADALIALHRSEGLGLHLLEAMGLGTPVVTSRYSGNLDFCDDSNSLLVEGALIPAHDASGQYVNLPSALWFDPNLGHAARALQKLASEEAYAEGISTNAKQSYQRLLDVSKLRDFLNSCLTRYDTQSTGVTSSSRISETNEANTRRNPDNKRAIGVNLVGYFEAEFGMGQYARRLLSELERCQIPTKPYLLRSRGIRSTELLAQQIDSEATHRAPYPINVVVINADDFPVWAATEGQGLIRDRYTIGVWAWELETFPPQLHTAFDYVDEVWAISRFSAAAIAEFAPVPVTAIPPLVEFPQAPPPKFIRSLVEVADDRFLMSYTFDYYGGVGRKNPAGVIEAFCRAFPAQNQATLLLKSTNAQVFPEARAELEDRIKGRDDIKLIDGYWSRAEVRSLLADSDAYISLHRSEGLGFGLAEAMTEGTEVIATNYGGNLDFMNEGNSRLVDFELARVGPGAPPYPAEALWAEPNVEQATKQIREVFQKWTTKGTGSEKRAKLDAQTIQENARSFFLDNLTRIKAGLPAIAPQPVVLYPAEGFSKPEGDHKNPTWWQIEPTGWLAFDQLDLKEPATNMVAAFTLINVPSKRPCDIKISFRDLSARVKMTKGSQRKRIVVPIGALLDIDEIKVECNSEPWRIPIDARSFYVQISNSKVEASTRLPTQIEVHSINEPSPMLRRLKKLVKP